MAAHRPEEILGLDEQVELAPRQHAQAHQFLGVTNMVEILCDPEQCIEITQPALAFLDIGLDQVTCVASLAVALVALGKLGGDEFRPRALHHFVVEALAQILEQSQLAAEEPGFENGSADGHVGARQANALIDIAGGVADLQAHVPQDIEDPLDDLLGPGRVLVGQHEQQIDVGARRQGAAAIAADGSDGQAFRHRGIFDAVDVMAGIIIRAPR